MPIELVSEAGAHMGTVGDVVNFGSKGYAAVSGGACDGDCLWEVSLATGLPVTVAPIKLPTSRRVTALGHSTPSANPSRARQRRR